MKVLVAHPGKQHSYRTAVAMQQGDMLFKYITTTYQKKGSITRLITRFLPEQTRKKAESHYESALDDDKVLLFDEGLALLSLFLEKIKFSPKILRKFNLFRIDHFSKKVAEYAIKNNVDAVIMWDTTSVECFKMLKSKAPHIKRILDCSTANRLYLATIYDEDMAKYHHECFKRDIPFLWDEACKKMYLEEIQFSETFVVASKFVEKSYRFSGVSSDQIHIIPYGVDLEKFKYLPKQEIIRPIKLIFVGGVTERKGIHHLLNVMSKFDSQEIVLDLVGGYDDTSEIIQRAHQMENVKLSGFVTRDALAAKYREADIFVFPTMGEGYGLVVLEAMACGLPAIVSDAAGGNDLIQKTDKVNGFEFCALDEGELERTISRILEKPDMIVKMSKYARETAEEHTWENYYSTYSRKIKEVINSEPGE